MSPEQFIHYLVGNPKFDAEHYVIFEKINIFKAQMNPTAEQGIAETQDILNTFIRHCEDEEAYMERESFPYLEYHKELHQTLKKSLQRFVDAPRPYVSLVKTRLYDFSIALAHHIDEADRQFYDLHKV
jgi:hemerythrin-like metal-binding protein